MFYYKFIIIFYLQLLFINNFTVSSSILSDFTKIREKRIIDGKLTTINKYPFQVAILNDNYLICSGSIITYKFILTAAHCFDENSNKNEYIIRAGSTNNNKGGFITKIKEIIIHEKYNNKNYDYDIALIKLNGKGYYSQIINGYLSIINLPKISPFQMKPKPYFAYLAGWGTINELNDDTVKLLREIKLQLMTQKACKILNENVTTRMICAGYIEGGKDACKGDSGGPLVINKNIIIGIVSWGEGCGRELLPSVFTHIYYLRNWIYQFIE